MKVELTNKELRVLLESTSPSMADCAALTENRMMRFNGNGWNESWNWNQKYLDKLTDEEIYDLYIKYRKTA